MYCIYISSHTSLRFVKADNGTNFSLIIRELSCERICLQYGKRY